MWTNKSAASTKLVVRLVLKWRSCRQGARRANLTCAKARHRTEPLTVITDIRRMHAVHFDRQRLRQTVRVTLVAWLFALSAGVLNACMLTPLGAFGFGVGAASPPRTAPHAEVPSPSRVVAHGEDGGHFQQHDPGPDSGRDSCLKFCDDESSALSKGTSSTLDPGVALLVGIARWNPIVSKTVLGVRLSLRQPPAQGPPLVIRYLRLTR